jgi:mono/diheme cytochrome c family protein
MYHTIVILHRIAVSLFLFHYMWKTYLLLADKKESLAGYTTKTRIGEMVISALFLLTGLYLVVIGPKLSTLQGIKLLAVLGSIPIAIMAFKKGNKGLSIISILLLIMAYGLAEMNKRNIVRGAVDTAAVSSDPIAVGKLVYQQKCQLCHGEAGDAMMSGSKNLQITTLTADEQKTIIRNGKAGMPAQKDLADAQIDGVIAYIATFKKAQ